MAAIGLVALGIVFGPAGTEILGAKNLELLDKDRGQRKAFCGLLAFVGIGGCKRRQVGESSFPGRTNRRRWHA